MTHILPIEHGRDPEVSGHNHSHLIGCSNLLQSKNAAVCLGVLGIFEVGGYILGVQMYGTGSKEMVSPSELIPCMGEAEVGPLFIWFI